MGWLQGADRRNQRRAERDNKRFEDEAGRDTDADAGPAEIAGSQLSLVSGWAGLVGGVVATVAGALRLRKKRRPTAE